MSPATLGRRVVLTVLLLGIGLIHALDLPGTWRETRWVAVAKGVLIVATMLGAEAMIRVRSLIAPLAAATLALGPLAGFILTRTMGLPGARGDVGKWLEPTGVASIYIELVTIAIALVAFGAESAQPRVVTRWAGPPEARIGLVPAPRVTSQRASAPGVPAQRVMSAPKPPAEIQL